MRGSQIDDARGSCRHGDKIGLEEQDKLQTSSASRDRISGVPLSVIDFLALLGSDGAKSE